MLGAAAALDPLDSQPTRGHGGLVIGRGGENVKRIERESGGARMKMHREKQVVVVTGFADQVARAVRLVEACVERAVALAERKELSGARGSAPGARDAARAAWTGPPETGEIVDDPRAAAGPAADVPGLGETEETFSREGEPSGGGDGVDAAAAARAEAEASA